MNAILREALPSDWPAILAVANVALPFAEKDNEEWLSNRQKFDASHFVRRHYVAEDSATGQVVAYGAVEEGPQPGQFRVFVVMEPGFLPGLGPQVYTRLDADLNELQPQWIWAREEARDPLVDFLKEYGFEEGTRFTLPNGRDAVVLSRPLP
jgi:hypothetical protein